nr:hypothetical protein [Actinoplanes humidus]
MMPGQNTALNNTWANSPVALRVVTICQAEPTWSAPKFTAVLLNA